MIDIYFRKYFENFPKLLVGYDQVEILHEENIWKIKARLQLFDNTFLWVREIWMENQLKSYSYYWLRIDNSLIMGWDNAPHHTGIKTYPHHRHLKDSIEPSNERSLNDVLSFVKNFLISE